MRKLGQALVLLVIAICAASATGFVVLAVQYHRFSADIQRSEAPLPATIRASLPPSKSTLDSPQVTLVRGSGGLASGGLVLFRTVPDTGTTGFLSVPPSTVLAGARGGRRMGGSAAEDQRQPRRVRPPAYDSRPRSPCGRFGRIL